MDKIWALRDLPPLRIVDNLAFKAEGYQVPIAQFIGALTWHWELVKGRVVDDEISTGDYEVWGSIEKGTTGHLLSEYQHRHMRIYRPLIPTELLESMEPQILKRMAYYGDQHYDYKGVLACGTWLLLRKMGFDVEWWVHNSKEFWCLESNNTILRDFSYPLVPDSEPPYPTNVENSQMLELIWGTF